MLILAPHSTYSSDPINMLDSSSLILTSLSFGSQRINQLMTGQSIVFDDAQQDLSYLKQQSVLIGDGTYTVMLFCPLFIENTTDFSFSLSITSLSSHSLQQNQSHSDLNADASSSTKESEEWSVMTESVAPLQNVILHVGDLSQRNAFDFNITASEMRIEIEYAENDRHSMIRYVNSTLLFLHADKLNLLIQNLQNQTTILGIKMHSSSPTLLPSHSHTSTHTTLLIVLTSTTLSLALLSVLAVALYQRYKRKNEIEEVRRENPER